MEKLNVVYLLLNVIFMYFRIVMQIKQTKTSKNKKNTTQINYFGTIHSNKNNWNLKLFDMLLIYYGSSKKENN